MEKEIYKCQEELCPRNFGYIIHFEGCSLIYENCSGILVMSYPLNAAPIISLCKIYFLEIQHF